METSILDKNEQYRAEINQSRLLISQAKDAFEQ